MTRCPDDSILQALITAGHASSASSTVESHVENCQQCQLRLEAMNDVGSIGSVLIQAAARPFVKSPSLMIAMERLQLEATALLDTPSKGNTDRTLTSMLSGLSPTVKEGFIGKLGDIEIRRVIGRGGMGVVLEGLDPDLNRNVAVKILSAHLLTNDDATERFLREAQAAAALTHENVVAIYAIERTDTGVPYLVLQLVAGESLAERLVREKSLAPDEVARIGAKVARGLAAAHARGLVHRDIKPANVLLEEDTGRVLLTDFGLAKVAGDKSMTQVGIVAGTPAFMSPEQATGADVDERSDLFSLGALLYSAASGRLAFSGDSPYVVLDRIRTASPRPLLEINPAVPAWLASIIHRLLEKDPEKRIQSASELADLLERQQAPTVRHRPRKRLTVLICIGAISLVAAVCFFFLQNPQSPSLVTTVRNSKIVVEGRPEHWTKLSDAVLAAPDGGTIIVHGDGPHTSSRIDIRGKRLTIRAAGDSRPLFVPDGTTRSAQWLTTDSDLTLDGLSAEWSGGAGEFDINPVKLEEGVVYSSAALSLHHCRLVSGPRLACIASSGQLVIEDCHLISYKGLGACLCWRATSSLTIKRTAMEGRNGVVAVAGSKATHMELSDCTLQTETAVMLVILRTASEALPITASRCFFDAKNVVTLYYIPAYQLGGRPTSDEMRTALRNATLWSDSENIYRRNPNYVTAWARNRPQSPGNIQSLAGWLEFWQQSDSKSIEADMHFVNRPDGPTNGPPRLESIDQPTGTPPNWVNQKP